MLLLFTRNEEGMRTVQKEEIQRVIVKREENSYKGDFGRLLLIGELTPMEELLLWQPLLRFIVVQGWLLSQQILII